MKTILIPFFDDDASESALSHAVIIAKLFNSHIEGTFVVPQLLVIDGGGGMAGIGVYATEIEKDSPLLAKRAKSRFESVLAQHNVKLSSMNQDCSKISADWRDTDKRAGPLLGTDGRIFDLIVLGRGFGHRWTDWVAICESALFESGRPVLIAPHETKTIGEHVAISWNGSTETARTIALCMPLLLEAKSVSVVTVDGWSVPGPDGEQVVNNLLRNGVNATLTNIDLNDRTPGRAIVEECVGVGADVLVKGAYTQSRLRQLVFGGATRHILHESNLPVIMAH